MIRVIIDGHDVNIYGGFSGPYINLTLSAQDAYSLLCRLQEKSDRLYDLATNYYECRECGSIHHLSVRVCPQAEYWNFDEDE